MSTLIGRHELKFHINLADCMGLRAALRVATRPDENSGDDNSYTIRSLYFDNYSDKAVFEKLSGQSQREKFRLRYYNDDVTFIRLEKKSKVNQLVYKESTLITTLQCEQLLRRSYNCLKQHDSLMLELYAKIHSQNLRPMNIVEYNREAYVYKAGNVRITLDTKIKTSSNVAGFLNPSQVGIPAANTIILEVKYDGFLPDFIRNLVQLNCRNQSEFSKYIAARIV